MQIAFLKFIDNYLGRLASIMLGPPPSCQIVEPATFLIIRPGGIGDAVLLIPTIKAIRKMYPSCTIDILAERRNAAVFQLVSGLRTIHLYDTFAGLSSVLSCRYDVVIDTEQWHRLSAVVARLVRPPMKIGFDTNERRRMFTHAIRYDLSTSERNNFFALLQPLGMECQQEVDAVTLTVLPQSVSKANELLQPMYSESFVAIFPGASIPEKRWGAGHFRRVAEMLSVLGIKIVVVGGKEDRQQGDVITQGGLGLNLAGLTSLSETAAVIQKSAMLLSGDSGVLHIAAGLGVPTVSLFGPGRASKWAPRGERHFVINKELPCSPCTTFGNTPPCPNDTRCMSDITVDEVVNAVTMLLTSLGAMPSRCSKRDWIETA